MRFPRAVRRDPDVGQWLSTRPTELRPLAERWFERMRHCGEDVCEILHDDYPTACVGEGAFAYVGAFKAHVNVGFFFGAELPDPKGLLVGTGKRMRHVKVRPGRAFDEEALVSLIVAAYEDMRRRLGSR